MIGFFILRRLIELFKVSSNISERKLTIYSCKNLGENVTKLNRCEYYELYDMQNEVCESKGTRYVANQFIHAYMSFPYRDDTRNWSDMYIVSDFDRNNCIWRVPLEQVRKLFLDAAEDYPSHSMHFDKSKGDWIITEQTTS